MSRMTFQVDTTHTANLKNFKGPARVIKAGQGFGPIMDELPGELQSTSVTFTGNNNYAHVDHSGTANHWFVLELPCRASGNGSLVSSPVVRRRRRMPALDSCPPGRTIPPALAAAFIPSPQHLRVVTRPRGI